MSNPIDELVSVDLRYDHATNVSCPKVMRWHGRTYHITDVGLHHRIWEGSVRIHVFSVTDGSSYFRLLFNTETLSWRLMEIDEA
jgi:hypothetical protein